MTKKEYEALKKRYPRPSYTYKRDYGHYRGYYGEHYQNSGKGEEPEDGYFAFFKLRCLICFVLFLALVAVDKRVDITKEPAVKQAVKYLNEESVPVNAILKNTAK